MCGIAAFSGNKNLTPMQARIASNKLKILGLYNQSRGTHGCGLYINGEIYKGVDDSVTKKNTKEFDDFLSNEDFIWPELDITKGNIMFLHTRQATNGAHVEANTHPFRIKSADPVNNLVGVHNGTIENIWTGLCKKYDLDHSGEHINVDSKALYTLIDRVGLEVLNEYKGYAALLWTKESDPHSIYVYHGAARKDRSSEEIWEERPMWYLRTAEGIYFSSLVSSLHAIRESKKQEVELLEYNTVCKITNGKFTSNKVKIDRKDANLTPVYVSPPRIEAARSATQQGQHCHVGGFNEHKHLRAIAEEASRSERLRGARGERGGKVDKDLKTPSESLVWKESVPVTTLATLNKEAIRFYKGRYRRGGGQLCNNLLYIKDRGIIGEEGDGTAYWFWQGVMLRDVECYEAMVAESKVKYSWVTQLNSNWAYCISRFSQYPVTNLESEAVDANNFFRFSWYYDEHRVKETIQLKPVFSGRCYTIVDGFCTRITPSNADDKNVLEGKQQELDLDLTPPHIGVVRNDKGILVPTESCCLPRVIKSPFDIVFAEAANMWEILNPLQWQAIHEFVADGLRQEWHSHPTHQEVQHELWDKIRAGIDKGKTIRESLGDKRDELEAYMKIIEQAPPQFVESIETIDSLETRLKYYDKHGKWPEESGPERAAAIAVDAETPMGVGYDDIPWDIIAEGADEELQDAAFFSREDMDAVDRTIQHIEEKRRNSINVDIAVDKQLDKLIETVHTLSGVADDLQVIDDSDLAQDVASVVYKGVSWLKHELGEACTEHHQEEVIRRLNEIVNN